MQENLSYRLHREQRIVRRVGEERRQNEVARGFIDTFTISESLWQKSAFSGFTPALLVIQIGDVPQ